MAVRKNVSWRDSGKIDPSLDEMAKTYLRVASKAKFIARNYVKVLDNDLVKSLLQGAANSPRTAQHFLNSHGASSHDKFQLLRECCLGG